jgi:succinate dehydrogenase / fumarate reductase, cytochrome b subunit
VTMAADVERSVEARTSFIAARLGSLLAVAPLGVWVVIHLWHNLSAFVSPAEWQEDVTSFPHAIAMGLSFALVLVPLVWHVTSGTIRTIKERPNYPKYAHFANLKFVVQRLSAIGLALFLGAHVWLAFIKPRFIEQTPETFANLSHEMHFHMPTLVVYALGILAVAYHLANGLHTAAMGWGVVSSRAALRRTEVVIWLVFLLLLAMGWGAVWALYAAGAQA